MGGKRDSVRSPAMIYWAMLVVLGVGDVYLLRQNQSLRTELEAVTSAERLGPGDTVAPFVASGLRGEVRITYSGTERKRVFLFLSPRCRYCDATLPYWQQILQRIDSDVFEVIVLVQENEDVFEVHDYLARASLDSAPVAFVPNIVRDMYRLYATPITLIVGNDGEVERAWFGAWGHGTLAEAGSALGIQFVES